MTELPWPPAAGLTGQVAAALDRSLLPSIIARGAAVRVASVQDGVATLELTGSPGAVMPLASRIEAQIRAAVPAITGVRIVTPGAARAQHRRPAHRGSAERHRRRLIGPVIGPVVGTVRD
jgi:Fe-S cluster biogenesis protein NfuA